MGKISKRERKILIREAQHYQTYPSKTGSRRMNKNQLMKGEMKERIEYEIIRNHEKLSNQEVLLLLQRELMKEEQSEEKYFKRKETLKERINEKKKNI
jgi:glutamate/tyrosine decarboxylase-like PLP-dependent enzyme